MIMQLLLKQIIFLFVKKIFEVYPTPNIWRYLPERDQKSPVEYRLKTLNRSLGRWTDTERGFREEWKQGPLPINRMIY